MSDKAALTAEPKRLILPSCGSTLNWRLLFTIGICAHFEAHSVQTGAVSGVQLADTEVCVSSNEIYWAPDVPSYEDVCL